MPAAPDRTRASAPAFFIPERERDAETVGRWEDGPIREIRTPPVAVHDARSDTRKFALNAEDLIRHLGNIVQRPWTCVNNPAIAIADGEYSENIIHRAGRPLLGTWRLARDGKVIDSVNAGTFAPRPAEIVYPGTTALIFNVSSGFYHFLMDVSSHIANLYRHRTHFGIERVVIAAEEPVYAKSVLEDLFPDFRDRIVWAVAPFRAERLVVSHAVPIYVYDETGAIDPAGVRQNARALRISSETMEAQHALFQVVDDEPGRFMADTPGPGAAGSPVVYIPRRGKRELQNEDRLLAALAPLKPDVLAMESLSAAEKVRALRKARVIIGPHGAGLSNAGFAEKGATIVELTSRHYIKNDRLPLYNGRLAALREAAYHFVVADEEGEVFDPKGVGNGTDVVAGDKAIETVLGIAEAALTGVPA